MKVVLLLIFSYLIFIAAEEYPLAIIHINDFHAKFEETDWATNMCKPEKECIGGYARVITVVKQLLEKHKNKNTLYLNGGDNFSGSLWYSMFRWEVTSELLNVLPADCMVIHFFQITIITIL